MKQGHIIIELLIIINNYIHMYIYPPHGNGMKSGGIFKILFFTQTMKENKFIDYAFNI